MGVTERGRYGAGSLRQRGPSTWELRVSAGRDAATHRYLQRTTTFRGTEKQARKALAAFVAMVESGSGKGGDATVAELMDA